MAANFNRDGFALAASVLSEAEVSALTAAVAKLTAATADARGRDGAYGLRKLLRDCAEVRALACSEKLLALLADYLGRDAFPVRALFFDKTPAANWRVPWHQDLTIAVAERIEVPGFGPWSVKDGVVHVQPPRQFLENMIALRLHLDDCDADNGPLRVVPGSHRDGKLGAAEIVLARERHEPVVCEARCGDVLLLRPLLLHSSSPARRPGHRRVLHLEYATTELPGGLRWFDTL